VETDSGYHERNSYQDTHISIQLFAYRQRGYQMKPQEQKAEFIRLRAEGKSYSFIAGSLKISKSTCTSWERELKA
jgi:DNA-directed RNA polymerase specialized sigma24 family protein